MILWLFFFYLNINLSNWLFYRIVNLEVSNCYAQSNVRIIPSTRTMIFNGQFVIHSMYLIMIGNNLENKKFSMTWNRQTRSKTYWITWKLISWYWFIQFQFIPVTNPNDNFAILRILMTVKNVHSSIFIYFYSCTFLIVNPIFLPPLSYFKTNK